MQSPVIESLFTYDTERLVEVIVILEFLLCLSGNTSIREPL